MSEDHPYRDSDAARMLAAALRRRQMEDGVSLRDLAKLLKYKQATVLSHMANGRVRVPLKRAREIASVVGLPEAEFKSVVVDQHQTYGVPERAILLAPDVPSVRSERRGILGELEALAGQRLESLSDEHKRILREVVAESRPSRRWLTISELPTVEAIRKAQPRFREAGLGGEERDSIQRVLHSDGS